jgi:uncharacterized protein Yka (UPF0111/DUF47 family)
LTSGEKLFKIKQTKEQVIFDKLTTIAADIRDAVELLRTLFKEYVERDYEQVLLVFTRIKSISDRVAMIREEIISTLYKEPFLPDFKETMLNLTQSLFEVTKAAKDSARALVARQIQGDLVEKIREPTMSYLAIVTEASAKLVLMISYLSNNVEESIRISKEIQSLERQGDELKDMIIETAYKVGSVDAVSIIQLRDFILFLDDVLDSMEEASLGVETFYVTLKS